MALHVIFDFVLNTADATHIFDMKAYMSNLVVNLLYCPKMLTHMY